MGLVNVRDNGGLLVPSTTTYAIASCAEKCLTGLLKSSDAVPAKLSLSVQCGVLKAMFENRSSCSLGHKSICFSPGLTSATVLSC